MKNCCSLCRTGPAHVGTMKMFYGCSDSDCRCHKSSITVSLAYQPISNNRMWKGMRFKSAEYNGFERDMLLALPRREMVPGDVVITYTFHLPNKQRRDISNFIKPLEDILVKKGYIEDDCRVAEFHVKRIYGPEWKFEVEIKPYV